MSYDEDFVYYPNLEDESFYEDIFRKKEFYRNKVPKNFQTDATIEDLCGREVILQPHQEFLRNFLSTETPYNGVLLFHGVGTGKTCAAVTIAEGLQPYLKQLGKKAYILTPVIPGFKEEIYSFVKEDLEREDGVEPGTYQCTGDTYYIPENPDMNKDIRKKIIKSRAYGDNSIYKFFGIGPSLNNYVDALTRSKRNVDIGEHFSNSLLIIDEAHRIVGESLKPTKKTGEKAGKKKGKSILKSVMVAKGGQGYQVGDELIFTKQGADAQNPKIQNASGFVESVDKDGSILGVQLTNRGSYNEIPLIEVQSQKGTGANLLGSSSSEKLLNLIYKIARSAKNLKIVLLTATPMKDEPTELVRLLNILRFNDKKQPILNQKLFPKYPETYLFDKDYLCKMARGYVSYLRGQYPINFPQVYDGPPQIPMNILYKPNPTYKITGNEKIEISEEIMKQMPFLVESEFGLNQYCAFRAAVEAKTAPTKTTTKSTGGREGEGFKYESAGIQISNIIYPNWYKTIKGKSFPDNLEENFKAMFPNKLGRPKTIERGDKSIQVTPIIPLKYEYKGYAWGGLNQYGQLNNPDQPGIHFLLEENLDCWAIKIKNILQNIRESTARNKDGGGIFFIYSNSINYGAIAVAMALELNGYARYSTGVGRCGLESKRGPDGKYLKNVVDQCRMIDFKYEDYGVPKRYRCYKCDLLSDHPIHKDRNYTEGIGYHKFMQGSFILITADVTAKQREEELKVLQSIDNQDGNKIHIVVGSQVTSEGLNFYNVRQVHILDPWHNYTRLYQTMGRAIRHCSHRYLPPEERNVYVYRYCTTAPKSDTCSFGPDFCANVLKPIDFERETLDEKRYLRIMDKDIQIKNIERTLKQIAIDCALFKSLNVWPQDQDGSRLCDYQNCNYECIWDCGPPLEYWDPDIPWDEMVNTDTYNIFFAQTHVNRAVRALQKIFNKNWALTIDDILRIIEKQNLYLDREHIFLALDKLLGNPPQVPPKEIKDRFKRSGYIIYRDGYYIFQPFEINYQSIPLYYRKTPKKIRPKQVPLLLKEKAIKEIKRKPINTQQLEADILRYIGLFNTQNLRNQIIIEYELDRKTSRDLEYIYENVIIRENIDNSFKDFKDFLNDYFLIRNSLLLNDSGEIMGHFIYNSRRMETKGGKMNFVTFDADGALKLMKEYNTDKQSILISRNNTAGYEQFCRENNLPIEEPQCIDLWNNLSSGEDQCKMEQLNYNLRAGYKEIYGLFSETDKKFKIVNIAEQSKDLTRENKLSKRTRVGGKTCSNAITLPQLKRMIEYLVCVSQYYPLLDGEDLNYLENVYKKSISEICKEIEIALRIMDKKVLMDKEAQFLGRWFIYPFENEYRDFIDNNHWLVYKDPMRDDPKLVPIGKDYLTGCLEPRVTGILPTPIKATKKVKETKKVKVTKEQKETQKMKESYRECLKEKLNLFIKNDIKDKASIQQAYSDILF